MPRYFFPTLIALSAVTGMVLAAAAVVIRPAESAQIDAANRVDSGEVAVRTAVERFYAAVNYGIETGDTGSLGSAISLDYAEGALTGHTTSAGDEINRHDPHASRDRADVAASGDVPRRRRGLRRGDGAHGGHRDIHGCLDSGWSIPCSGDRAISSACPEIW